MASTDKFVGVRLYNHGSSRGGDVVNRLQSGDGVERFLIEGPTSDRPVVEAWANDYIHFDNVPAWQKQLREEIRTRCRELSPSQGQLLHAAFFGPKLPNADVENLTIYNIGSFKEPGANGIRFELGDTVPPAPDGVDYRFGYRYALEPRSASLTHWRPVRKVAAFDWTDLGKFTGEKKLAKVWRAIACGQVDVGDQIAPDAHFAVLVALRPPHGTKPVWGGMVKGVFDGVICALQGHAGEVSPDLVERLAKQIDADPECIERLLLEPRWNVLGDVPTLVSLYQAGVKWNPSDHLCVAGELIAAEPEDDRWAIKGEVFEISR